MLIQNATSNLVTAPVVTNDHAGSPAVVVPAPNIGNVLPAENQQPVVTAHAASSQVTQPSEAQLQGALDKINQAMRQNNTNLEFSIDQESKQMLIKVVDSSTGEIIRQFPSKEILAISESIDQFQKGLLIKQKA